MKMKCITYFNLTLSNMDTSYHLGWETWAGRCKLWFIQMSESTVGFPLFNVRSLQSTRKCAHTHAHKKKAVYTGCLKVVSKGFWISVVRVVNVVSYVLLDIYLLFRTACGTESLSVINSKMALNLFAPVHSQCVWACTEGFLIRCFV